MANRHRKSLVLRNVKSSVKALTILLLALSVIGIAYANLIGEKKEILIPVTGANKNSWDSKSFWHSPWGKSKVHKGIDIFATRKSLVISPINGLIISAGYSENGGNYVYVLDAKLRTYYFAHLNRQEKSSFSFIKKGQRIGLVGNSGNAISSPPHLHFSIFSLFPIIKNYSRKEKFTWMKMFYLDPVKSFKTT
ncbi:M23 family metallopeptidase [Pedobacter frigiditerrae]|uniref:M23 family metallopeptidase n=1 Tax=Pedobacter frigiditerrae TaxID=2530452 RepID=A0A4R0MN40_9SPHI|nr:M23 family metallopeptidase [Pedobacter frigiditerrae]TCC88043.1 M23 family metallopeptidase [Pedobacter frigiditerrae]